VNSPPRAGFFMPDWLQGTRLHGCTR
jgi:hypothetical protein